MEITLTLGFISFFFSLTLFIAFSFSKKEKTPESDLFFKMLIVDLFGILLEMFCTFSMFYSNVVPFANILIMKMYYVIIALGVLYIMVYNCFIYNEDFKDSKKGKRVIRYFSLLFIIEVFIIVVGDISFVKEYNDVGRLLVYNSGFVPTTAVVYTILLYIFSVYYFIKHHDYYFIQRLLCLIFFTLILISNSIFWEYNFIFCSFTLIILLIYFLIENFDVKKVSQLKQMKEKINHLNEDKNRYLSNMSREIRNNLNTIVVSSNYLLESNEYEEINSELKELVYASDSLLEIVGNILDLNKIESDNLESSSIVYNFKEEARSIADMNMIRIENKPIQFIMNIDPTIPDSLYGDKTHIKQILNNLISNAFKYTKEGSVIFKVNGTMDQLRKNTIIITVEVKDTGIGIKDTNKLFTKFDRLGMDKDSNIEGTGLGLVITKRLVDLVDGELDVHSEYGKGSSFVFTFRQKIADTNLATETHNYEIDYDFNHKKILLVDDNVLNLKVLSRVIEEFNCSIDQCKATNEVFEKIASNHYDLVFSDIFMRGINGYDILHYCNKFRIPVVAVTADAINGAQDKYIKEGFSGYVSKPYSKKDIYKEMVNILKKK